MSKNTVKKMAWLHLCGIVLFVSAPLITYLLQGTSMEDVKRSMDTGANMDSVFVRESWIRFSVQNFILCGLFYFNYLFLVPRFLLKDRKWLLYSCGVAIAVLAFTFFIYEAHVWIDWIIHARPMKFAHRFVDTFLTDLLLLSGGTLLCLNEYNRQLAKEQIEKEKRLLESELKFLRSQINPHFLFNSLNNIYSTSLSDPAKTSDALLRLSSLLRFILHDSGKTQIPVAHELEYIRNYVDLELMRLPACMTVHYEHKGNTEGMIHPMLLIPFIENAFKHGRSTSQKSDIIIRTELENGHVKLFVENNIFNRTVVPGEGGIGLANTQRRLNLLYPGNHQLHIDKKENKFSVHLSINLHENTVHSHR